MALGMRGALLQEQVRQRGELQVTDAAPERPVQGRCSAFAFSFKRFRTLVPHGHDVDFRIGDDLRL